MAGAEVTTWWWDDGEHWLPRIKSEAIELRIKLYGRVQNSCPCDFCEVNPGIEYHHICSRGRTVQNVMAEALADAPELCSLLCTACHMAAAPTKYGRKRLLLRNTKTYGYQNVKRHLIAVNFVVDTGVRMPAEESDDNRA
jgi:hypothetical protein